MNELAHDVLKALPIPAVLIDANARLGALNDAAQRLWQGTARIGDEWYSLFDDPPAFETLGVTPRDVKVLDGEWVRIHRRGALLTLTPVGDLKARENQRGHLLDSKRAARDRERLLRRLESKTDELERVIYITSHDLRSPLVNVEGFSHELEMSVSLIKDLLDGIELPAPVAEQLDQLLNEELPAAVGFIHAGAGRMNTLLNGLLRLSRFGHCVYAPKRVDLAALIAELLQAMKFQLNSAKATLAIGALPDVLADTSNMAQVFSNLLDNAIKYRDPNRPLQIAIAGVEHDGVIEITVRDTGLGIPESHQPRVFDIFHRVGTLSVKGEGLGLAVVRRIVDRNGGSIQLESVHGEGSAFVVTLPSPEPT